MDQWPLKFVKSVPRDWHWSMDGSSQRALAARTVFGWKSQLEIAIGDDAPSHHEIAMIKDNSTATLHLCTLVSMGQLLGSSFHEPRRKGMREGMRSTSEMYTLAAVVG